MLQPCVSGHFLTRNNQASRNSDPNEIHLISDVLPWPMIYWKTSNDFVGQHWTGFRRSRLYVILTRVSWCYSCHLMCLQRGRDCCVRAKVWESNRLCCVRLCASVLVWNEASASSITWKSRRVRDVAKKFKHANMKSDIEFSDSRAVLGLI